MMPRSESENRRSLLNKVMLAVLAWGGMLALGAFLFGYDHQAQKITLDPSMARGSIVFSFVGIFLGGWALLLRKRNRRVNRDDD